MRLVGRQDELRTLEQLLDGARGRLGGALVLQGEPGIGKTSLLDHAVASAGDFALARLGGLESEMELPFAGLHRLLARFLAGCPRLPSHHRSALATALGLEEGPPPDRFIVGLGTLALLAWAAEDRPLLCVVDDAQWLDTESVDALGLVARRLYAEGVVLLFGLRDLSSPVARLDGVPVLHVGGLLPEDGQELLRSVVPGPVDSEVARRIVTQTGGSPMAIAELAGELTEGQLSGAELLPEPLPLSRHLEGHFHSRVQALPADTQLWLLLAAAEPTGDAHVIADAAVELGIRLNAADPAVASGVFVLRPEPRFRHPLIRSAVYSGVPAHERRRVHQALATVTDQRGSSDRRAWHLAAAATGRDEVVASELERAAVRARARGGFSAAGAFLATAARLTPDEARRTERTLAAATAHLTGGSPGRARQLLASAAPDIVDPYQRALADRLQGTISSALGEARRAPSLLVHAARSLQPFDMHLACSTLLDALAAARGTGRFAAPGETERDICLVARSMPLPPGATPTVGDLLLDGIAALYLDGPAMGVPILREALTALRGYEGDPAETLSWLAIACWAAGAIGDEEILHALATRFERVAREARGLVPLSRALLRLGMSELLNGSVTRAQAHFDERTNILQAIGRPTDVATLLSHAWSGRELEARSESAAVRRSASERAQDWILVWADYALTILEIGLGNYHAAFEAAKPTYRLDPFLSMVTFPSFIEAAVRCGERSTAVEALTDFASRFVEPTPLIRALYARSRAVVAEDAEAEPLYKESIHHFHLCRADLQRARAHLLYGEWLRRQQRRTDARGELRTAYEMFSAMGSNAFATRARVELAATGERARRRAFDTAAELTPQESQIARLASQGATNSEIAAKLFLSPNTVDYHLRKVYRKLSLTSRRQLAQALPA